MDYRYCYAALLILTLYISFKFIRGNKNQNQNRNKNLPPSPPALPILGHFYLISKPIHHSLHKISKKYGPILFLKFGHRDVLLLTNPSDVEECFAKNDIVFANRPMLPSRKRLDYNFTVMSTAPYGDLWRNLRRYASLEIFSTKRLQMSSDNRASELRFLIKKLYKRCSQEDHKVNMKILFYVLTINNVMKMVTGDSYHIDDYELGSAELRNKYDGFKQIFTPWVATPIGDYFPFLRRLTCYGSQRKMDILHRKRDLVLQDLIHRQRSKKSLNPDTERKHSIIDKLLSLQESEPEFYTDDIQKGIIMVVLIAGTDTSVLTMESAVLQLISHPDALDKARNEIDAKVGTSRLLEESDLGDLTYLHCVINETLRLGPVGPILVPHESSEECRLKGFDIPKGTILLVNTWAMNNDAELWEDADMFKPERFEGVEMNQVGFKFLPFGAGRRKCPGEGLAMRIMGLALGTLIQCFDWEKVGDGPTKEKGIELVFRPREGLVHALSCL